MGYRAALPKARKKQKNYAHSRRVSIQNFQEQASSQELNFRHTQSINMRCTLNDIPFTPIVNESNTFANAVKDVRTSKNDWDMKSTWRSEGGLVGIIGAKLRSMLTNSFEENVFLANIVLQLVSIPTYTNTEEALLLHSYFVGPSEESLFGMLESVAEEVERHGVIRQTIKSSIESFSKNEEVAVQNNVSLAQ